MSFAPTSFLCTGVTATGAATAGAAAFAAAFAPPLAGTFDRFTFRLRVISAAASFSSLRTLAREAREAAVRAVFAGFTAAASRAACLPTTVRTPPANSASRASSRFTAPSNNSCFSRERRFTLPPDFGDRFVDRVWSSCRSRHLSRSARARALAASTCSLVAFAIVLPMLDCSTFCSAAVRSERTWSRGLTGLRDLAIGRIPWETGV